MQVALTTPFFMHLYSCSEGYDSMFGQGFQGEAVVNSFKNVSVFEYLVKTSKISIKTMQADHSHVAPHLNN